MTRMIVVGSGVGTILAKRLSLAEITPNIVSPISYIERVRSAASHPALKVI